MMSSHDNPPRRGTRSWSTPDPVSRGRRYSHHSRRKNEKDGGFNNTKNKSSVLFSSKERREREREREKEKREESAPSNYTLSSQESASFSCHRAYNNRQKKELLLLLLLTWLGQFTTRKDNAPRGGKPKVVIFFLVGKGGGASMMRV